MKYIILRNSTEQAAFVSDPNTPQGHNFRVVMGGLQPVAKKAQTLDTTIEGELDMSIGSIRDSIRYQLYVVESDPEGYGNLSDLRTLFNLNEPNETITNLITLVDHGGTTIAGYLVGDHMPAPQTTILTGTGAIYLVPIEFMAKAKTA
jgi:hypothetical protein